MKTITHSMLAFFVGSTVFAAGHVHAVAGAKESGLVVSVEAMQRPLKDVLAEISAQTSWTVVVDERLGGKTVSGQYKDVELETLLRRSLKGEAHVVQYDEEARRVEIRSFGQPGGMLTIVAASSHSEFSADDEKIKAMRLEEQKAYEDYVSNPNSIEPTSGMTLSQFAAMRAEEQKVYEEYLANPDSIEPTTGMKLKNLRAMQAEEERLYIKEKANRDSVETLTGMTLQKIVARKKEE